MEPVLFYGVPEGCSFGAIVALEWSGLPYRLCRVEMPGVVSSDAYRRINPVGETPTLLTEDGRLLSQSMAIFHHIAARSSDASLRPAPGTPAFDRMNESLAFLNTGFFGAFAPLWYAFEHESADKQALVDMGTAKVRKAHANLDTLLGDQPWLGGEQRSLADAYFPGIARWNDFHKVVDRREFPNVQRLHDKLQEDPAVRFAHAIEEQQPARSAGGFAGHVGLEEALERAAVTGRS
ncbi:glutathione S-transferase family protein [Ramlibacter sp.]|uniref:glutathione S-transferase family protein n=1 Tax=Ramlibacter sp. TaxID=1917967 RepID=UPI001797C3FE|nr:glutathione S-transferase family protein [Ramlibacter sp.]MBA2675962.1 glutathione S-transferase family protein [Ramlibacter sp.]